MNIGTLDFETHSIQPRPQYPPVPVGVALKSFGRRAQYFAWGHPSANNCSKAEGLRHIRTFVREHTLLCHHAGFDLDVLETHCGIKWPATHHDTLLLAFLEDPDSDSLSLKPLAQRYLGEPPTEQDAVRDYCLHQAAQGNPAFKGVTRKNFGAYIAMCPGDLIGRYAAGDVNRTETLYRFFKRKIADQRMWGAYERELRLTPVLIGMERRGVPLDEKKILGDIVHYEGIKAEIEHKLLAKLKIPIKQRREIVSNYEGQDYFKWGGKAFAEQLVYSGLVDELPQTDNGNNSTSAESLAEVLPPKLALEFEVRAQIATCLQTFMRPWLVQAQYNGHFHARFNQVRNGDEWGKKIGARTGRLSMSPNLQNVIRSDKDPRVPKLRNYVVPGKKYAGLVIRDYSQQELRDLAHYEDGPFKASYIANPKQDAHQLVRELIFQTTRLQLERRPVKDLNFGLIYGQGLNLTAQKMGVSKEDAKRARAAHSASLPGVPKLIKKLNALCDANEPIFTWGGRRYYCEPPKLIKGRWWDFRYKMLNKLIQGSAADQTKQAMINYSETEWAEENPLLLQVHDDLMLGLRRKRDVKHVHTALRDAMMDLKDFSIPMLSEGKIGWESWGTAVKVEW